MRRCVFSLRFWLDAVRSWKLARLPLLARVLTVSSLTVAAAWAAPGTQVGQSASDFALPAARGDNVRLSEYVGQPVILWFWSSSCSVCAAQLARLGQYYDTYHSSGLIVLAVSVDDDMVRAAKYAGAHPSHFPMLLDAAKSVGRAYGIDRLPTTVMIDRGGVIRYVHEDYRANDRSYIPQIRSLLDDVPSTTPSALVQ